MKEFLEKYSNLHTGRKSLQIYSYIDDTKVEIPENLKEYFYLIKHRAPSVGKEDGYICMSKNGYEKHKNIIKDLYLNNNGGFEVNWEEFEKYIDEHFKQLQNGLERRIVLYRRKLNELEKFKI